MYFLQNQLFSGKWHLNMYLTEFLLAKNVKKNNFRCVHYKEFGYGQILSTYHKNTVREKLL